MRKKDLRHSMDCALTNQMTDRKGQREPPWVLRQSHFPQAVCDVLITLRQQVPLVRGFQSVWGLLQLEKQS